MDYTNLSGFLNKFKELLSKSDEANKIIIDTITTHLSYPIEASKIKIKGTVIHIEGSPVLRSEILIHKAGILSDLANMVPSRKFTDIR